MYTTTITSARITVAGFSFRGSAAIQKKKIYYINYLYNNNDKIVNDNRTHPLFTIIEIEKKMFFKQLINIMTIIII